MASAATRSLILLGNSGVGKSFLANRILDDDDAFESRFSPRSVTRHTEWKDMSTVIGKYIYSVANIPGLVEANQKLIDENRVEIMKAFEQCPFGIVLFVFGNTNGRIAEEDLVAFMRINDAYEFPTKSLILIINGIPPNRPHDYEEKTIHLLEELTHIDKSYIYFIEKATSEKSKKDIHDLLHGAIAQCEPTYHKKKHDIELLAEEISRLKKERKHRQDQLLAQQTEYGKRKNLNLTLDSTLEPHRPSSQQLLTITVESKSDVIDHNKRLDEMMENTKAEHYQIIEEFKKAQQNLNTDAVKQLIHQHKMENDLNKELLDQISSAPPVIVVFEKQPENVVKTTRKRLAKVFNSATNFIRGEHRSSRSNHRTTSCHDNSEDNFQSSASHSLDSRHQNRY